MKKSSSVEAVNLHEKGEIWMFTNEDLKQRRIHIQGDLKVFECQ